MTHSDRPCQTSSRLMTSSASGAFVPLIHSQLAELRKQCGSFGHRRLRDSINAAEEHIQALNSATDVHSLDTSMAPFFVALGEKKRSPFQRTVLDTFFKVFKQATPDMYPSRELTCKIVSELVKIDSDDLNLLCCNICIACLRSCCGIYFCHGTLLRKMFKQLFMIYNSCENTATEKSIKTAIRETTIALFDSYPKPPELPNTNDPVEFSKRVASGICENAACIQEHLRAVLDLGDFTPSIRDVDMFVTIGLFARIVEEGQLKFKTVRLAAKFLVLSLKRTCDFFETDAFRVLLTTQINVAFLSLALDVHPLLATATADLILTIWSKFAHIYNEGLNNFLVRGLATTLTSPNPVALSRSLAIYKELAKYPQFFVDAFVNYDCDESGFFGNVFENTMNLLVKLAYPDVPVHKEAIEVITRLLESLWNYWSHFEITEGAVAEPEAPANFLEAKRTKNVFTIGLEVFKKGFKKGIEYFKANNFVKDDPENIARFLFETPALDPTEVGQFIGNSRHVDILKHFATHFDFRNKTFEAAFREFLQKFQIPGEAQMIDRVMEQFGTQFYNDNKEMFSCADTVYVLAFSALMLHTDAHHPNVKSRMTLDQFVSNNAGIDGGRDLPNEFLADLYKGITTKRIYLSSSAGSRPSSSLLTRAQKADVYQNQCQETITEARQATGPEQSRFRTFHRSESPLFIGPMFQAVWRGPLAVLTILFQDSNAPDMYRICLKGLGYCVHIASHCFIENALDTLVDSFGTFTGLRVRAKDAHEKNIECTNELIEIAHMDRNYLRGAWEIVMGELSALNAMTETSVGVQYNVEVVDTLFATTQELDRESIVDFIAAVRKVSSLELAESPPRLFLLERLRVVAHLNMSRPRFVWLSIWELIGSHIKKVCCSPQIELAYVGIDMLRRLAQRFLEEQELTQFHFQRHFMTPFIEIYVSHANLDAKDYLQENIIGLVRDRAEKLQSGWSVIIEILLVAATERTGQARAFDIVSVIISRFLDIVSDKFADIISILLVFCNNAECEIRRNAVKGFISVSRKIPHNAFDLWTMLFDGLSRAGQDVDDDVRKDVYSAFLEIANNDEPLSDEVMGHVLAESLPQMFNGTFTSQDECFFVSVSEFQLRFYDTLITPNWHRLHIFFEPLIKCLCANVACNNEVFARASIETLSSFMKTQYEGLSDDDRKVFFEHMTQAVTKAPKFSTANGALFMLAIEGIHVVSNSEWRFVDLIRACDKASGTAEAYITWALVRTVLLRVLIRYGVDVKDDVTACVKETLKRFMDKGFFLSVSGDEAKAWNEAVVESLTMMNVMEDRLFRVCFDACCDEQLELINAVSSDVRKQISAAFQRKLL